MIALPRIGLSNLAWALGHDAEAMALVAEGGGKGVEVAPTRLARWDSLTSVRLAKFNQDCKAAGLQVSSLQAIFYDVPDVALLGETGRFVAMCEHLKRVGDVALALGAHVAVFGAPRSRLKGALSDRDAQQLATERLRTLGDIAAEHALCLGMEALPPYYGCDFLTRPSEVAAMVAACAHPFVQAHLDIACATLAGCDPASAVRESAPVHFHISEPDLAPLHNPRCDHVAAAHALREIEYDGWCILEMREDKDDDLAAIREAVAFAIRVYGSGLEGLS